MNPETLERLKRLLSYDRMYQTHHRDIAYVERDSQAVLDALLDELIAHMEHAPDHDLGYAVDHIQLDIWAKFNMSE